MLIDDLSALGNDKVALNWLNWLSLVLALVSVGGVLLHTVQKLFATSGLGDVLNSDADFLPLNAAANWLVDHNANSMWGNVEHLPSLSMVELVRK
jgi:hypothetical protein